MSEWRAAMSWAESIGYGLLAAGLMFGLIVLHSVFDRIFGWLDKYK
jgi:hypothetical protein